MEMGIVTALCVALCGLCALCCVACLIVMLSSCKAEGENPPVMANAAKEKPPDDVEKRRRQAVQAAHHRNFMDYDGSPQQPVDPNTILADGG